MTSTTVTSTTVRCPVCGDTVQVRKTGRPARFCSTRCRQIANRAKLRAQAAVADAARARAELLAEITALGQAAFALHHMLDAPSDTAAADTSAAAARGEDGWRVAPPTGWEPGVAEAAITAARLARATSRAAGEHTRAAAEHRRALRTAGIGLIEASAPATDETPPPAPAADPGGEVRDRFFDAVEDLIGVVDPTSGIDSRLPTGLADALDDPANTLTDVFVVQAGDGPLGDLAAAVAGVLAAAGPYRADWPVPLAEACDQAAAVLGDLTGTA
ncbi:MAG TPA: hypothetical protein VGD91_23610 [Trebonia sp.]